MLVMRFGLGPPTTKQYDRLYQAALFVALAALSTFGMVVVPFNEDLPTANKIAASLGFLAGAVVCGSVAFVLLRRWWRNRPAQSH